MSLKTASQLRIIASNLLSEVNDGLTDLREGTLPQARTEVEGFLDEVQDQADTLLGIAQTFVVDLKAVATKSKQ